MSYVITELDGKQTSAAGVETTEVTTDEVVTESTTEVVDTDQETEVVDEQPSGHFWGDLEVEVSIPDEVSTAFEEKGIDGQAVLSELFAKDGKFELKEETKAKLYEAFGKPLVDGYLNLYKGQNEMAVSKYRAEYDAQQTALANNAKEFSGMVSDEQWAALDEWCSESLPEPELAAFNAVMSLPAEHWVAQKAVLQTLLAKHQAAQADAQGDGSVTLLGDEGAASGATTGGLPKTLTRSEFQQLMFSDKYRKEPEYARQVDAIRQKSQQAGIH